MSDVKGFADVHNRKNQLKFLYDFDHIHLDWTATLDPHASELISGKIEVEEFNCTNKLDSLQVKLILSVYYYSINYFMSFLILLIVLIQNTFLNFVISSCTSTEHIYQS